MRALILIIGGLLASLVFAKPTTDLDPVTRSEIGERIAPVGSVCLIGDECASGAGAVASSGPRSGEAIYNDACINCHASGLLGAPKKGDAEAWAKAEKVAGGFSSLLSNAINGIRNMPAKGTCMECSDDEISVAIEYMSGLKP